MAKEAAPSTFGDRFPTHAWQILSRGRIKTVAYLVAVHQRRKNSLVENENRAEAGSEKRMNKRLAQCSLAKDGRVGPHLT
jgi:hypothetical protein